MKTSIKITVSGIALAMLAACGGSGSSDNGNKMDDTATMPMPTPTPTPSPSPDTRDAGQLLFDGETLTARNISQAIRQRHEEGMTELIDPVDFTIMRTEDGEYVVTLGGVEHTFTRDERDRPHGAATDDDESLDMAFTVYGWTRRDFHENLDNGHSRGTYQTIWEGTRDFEERDGTDDGLRAFGIFGNPTTDFNHLNDMTATYTGGWVWLPLYAATFEAGNFDRDEDRLSLYTDGDDVAFTANFADGTLSGHLTGFREWDDGTGTEVPYDLTLTMPETPFGTEALQGRFTVSGEAVREGVADYDASFWGPDADHLAGTINISGTAIDDGDRTPFVGIGHFSVGKDE